MSKASFAAVMASSRTCGTRRVKTAIFGPASPMAWLRVTACQAARTRAM